MPKCDACRAEGATQRCTKCQGCWSCDKACAKRFWRTHKKFCTDDPALKPRVPIELAVERALAKEPMTEPPPENATCYICLETEGPNGGKVTRACACRGPSAGFAHVDCLAEMASRNQWMTVDGDRHPINRWYKCTTCQQRFELPLSLEMARRSWRRAPPDDREAGEKLAFELSLYSETDAADRLLNASDGPSSPSSRGFATSSDLMKEVIRGCILCRSNRLGEALEVLTRMLPTLTRYDLPVRSYHAQYMAATLSELGRHEEALAFAVESAELFTRALGKESREALSSMSFSGEILIKLGRYREAEARLTHVLAVLTRVLGADHEETEFTRKILATIPEHAE